ncbi:MAG TPA: hypothetical protein VJX67_27730 [Blastocatellia bacterium]|nr:hypothetical protein [Blastocatellia bacterium]
MKVTVRGIALTVGSSLLMLFAVACNSADAPKTVSTSAQPGYTIVSEKPDPSTGGLIVNIKVPQPVDQTTVKSIAESVINARRAGHSSVTVNTYVESAASVDIPYAVSTFNGVNIGHRFNPEAAQQRIPTH